MGLPKAVIFGHVGSGKTTITNMLTGEHFKTSGKGFSCTREIQEGMSEYHPFKVVDFPGTDSAVEQVLHVKIQEAALRSISFNTICLTCTMSERASDIINRLTKIKRLFCHHLENVVVIMTKCEGYTEDQKREIQTVIDLKLGFEHCFFKTNETGANELSRWIYDFIKRMSEVKVGEGIFNSQSLNGLVNDIESDMTIFELRGKSEKRFEKIYEATLKFFKETNDRELKRALYFSLKQHMDQITDEYAKEIAPYYKDKWELNAELLVLQFTVMSKFSSFKKMVIDEIRVESSVYGVSDAKPGFRRCSCGLIWFRVYGCSSIVCGKRSLSKDFSNHNFYNYVIQWVGETLRIEKKEDAVSVKFSDKEFIGLTPEEIKENEEREKAKRKHINPVGCGKRMDWKDMEDVTGSVVEQLKDFDFDLTSETDNIVKKHEDKVNKFGKTDENECAICFKITDRKRILIPCGHTKYCESCIQELKECSICKTQVNTIIRVF